MTEKEALKLCPKSIKLRRVKWRRVKRGKMSKAKGDYIVMAYNCGGHYNAYVNGLDGKLINSFGKDRYFIFRQVKPKGKVKK